MQVPPVTVNFDIAGLAQGVVNGIIEGIRQLVNPLPVAFIEWVYNGIQQILTSQGANNVLTRVPLEYTTSHGEIVALWKEMLIPQLSLMTLVLIVQGFRIMSHQIDLMTAVFRTGFLYLLGISMIWWAGMIFTVMNALSAGIGGTPLWIDAQHLPNDFVMGLLLIVAGFFAVLAWIKGAVGVVFLDVLIVVGPFIFTLAALPWFSGLGKWWLEEFTTWTLRGFMVALVLRIGLGISVIDVGGFQALMALVSFWLAWQMDTKLRRFSVGTWGSISQLNLLNRGATAVAGWFSGGAAAGAAVGAATAPSSP